MLGKEPGLPDVLIWHVVWFLRGRWADGPAFLEEFTNVTAWEARMDALGQGDATPMSAEEAIAIAQSHEIATLEATDARDPQGLKPGDKVAIGPDLNGGEQAVEGVVRMVSRDQVAIDRTDARAGLVCVHFPRAGYRITRI